MKITNDGHISLTHDEFMRTRDIKADQLNCGHYIIPTDKKAKSHQKTVCPSCGKKTFHTGTCNVTDAI